MKSFLRPFQAAVVLCVFLTVSIARADEAALLLEIKKLKAAVAELERKITLPATPVKEGIRGTGLNAFNPEIGVVADITGSATEQEEDEEGNDRFSVRELEFVIGSDIDPYSRFDATITVSDFEEVGVEEAYITHWGLPWDIKGRFGRIRPRVGIAAAQHRDRLDTVDQPLVVQRYFGVEGFSRTGLELSDFIPLPWENVAHELSVGLLEGGIGEDGSLFGETRRAPTFYSRLRNAWTASDLLQVDLGGTFLLGSSDEDTAAEVRGYGVDLTVTHFLNALNRVKWQSELYTQDRHVELDTREHPFGLYSLLDYRLAERWSGGARFDYVEQVAIGADDVRAAESGWSGYLTFHQSEFARWRFQYQHIDILTGGDDNRFFLQGTFAIGVHKHALQ